MSRDGKYKPSDARIITIPVSPEFHRRLRVHLAEEGRTMKWLGIRALETYLNSHDRMKQIGVVVDAAGDN